MQRELGGVRALGRRHPGRRLLLVPLAGGAPPIRPGVLPERPEEAPRIALFNTMFLDHELLTLSQEKKDRSRNDIDSSESGIIQGFGRPPLFSENSGKVTPKQKKYNEAICMTFVDSTGNGDGAGRRPSGRDSQKISGRRTTPPVIHGVHSRLLSYIKLSG